MSDAEPILEDVRAALRADARISLDGSSMDLDYDHGRLTLAGEVENSTAKRIALARAATIDHVDAVVDQLRIEPHVHRHDDEIRDDVRDALFHEPVFAETAIREKKPLGLETVREPKNATGAIEISVDDAVVTLTGKVVSLSHKRMAGVQAWWVPGSRDIVNKLVVDPPQEDNDAEITDAVSMVLETDPFVDASQVHAAVRNKIVTLTGYVPTEAERDAAEFDAWYTFGVDKVVNQIEVGL